MKKTLIFPAILMSMIVGLHLAACKKDYGNLADSSLTTAEKQGLAFMREEEKMAFDVYTMMYNHWGLTPFQQISQSEASHMAAIKNLLNRYGLSDPSAGKGIGEFTNPAIQQLYDMLLRKGDSSAVQALIAGALIEEVDITDLKEQLLSTGKTDIRQVYENLMRGSRNHLRSFVENLSLMGVTYVPQYLSAADYAAIINSPVETGGYRSGD